MIELGLFILMVSISGLIFLGGKRDSVEVIFRIPLVRVEYKSKNKENTDGRQCSPEDK